MAKDYLSLEVYQGLASKAVTVPDEITYKAGRKPTFAFWFVALL